MVGSDGKSLSFISVESISKYLASDGDGNVTRKSVDIKGTFMNDGEPTDCMVSILEPQAKSLVKSGRKCAAKKNPKTKPKIKAKCGSEMILTKGDDGKW